MKDTKALITHLYSKQDKPLPQTSADIYEDGESVLIAAEVLVEVLIASGIIEEEK